VKIELSRGSLAVEVVFYVGGIFLGEVSWDETKYFMEGEPDLLALFEKRSKIN